MKLPAGLMDRDIEFFLYKGELMVLHNSKIKSFNHLPAAARYFLEDLLDKEPDANLALDCLAITDHYERLRQFAFCRFSSFDLEADIDHEGMPIAEFTHCEKRGKCPAEGTLCLKSASSNKLSSREIEVIRLIARDLPNKIIADEMDISLATVSTHIQNIQTKIGVHSKYGIVAWAYSKNLIDESSINNNSLWKTEDEGGKSSGRNQRLGDPAHPRVFSHKKSISNGIY